jgi:hypothetical protein
MQFEGSKTEYKEKSCTKIAGTQINTDYVSIRVISSWTELPSKMGPVDCPESRQGTTILR